MIKALISLRGCAGWYGPLLFANQGLSHVMAHFILNVLENLNSGATCIYVVLNQYLFYALSEKANMKTQSSPTWEVPFL